MELIGRSFIRLNILIIRFSLLYCTNSQTNQISPSFFNSLPRILLISSELPNPAIHRLPIPVAAVTTDPHYPIPALSSSIPRQNVNTGRCTAAKPNPAWQAWNQAHPNRSKSLHRA